MLAIGDHVFLLQDRERFEKMIVTMHATPVEDDDPDGV